MLPALPFGIINLDKPAGISSAFAVGGVKRLLPKGTKIGHAGTLDPFATGVLLLLVGKATKTCEQLMDRAKQYEAVIRLGATTATDDLDSPAEPFACDAELPTAPPTREAVADALAMQVGEVMQRPPVFSAIKVGGRRAYALARRGEAVALPPRVVSIYRIDLLDYTWPEARVRVDCGRGTYVRAIARDLGERLGVGGYLTALRRTAIGPFSIADAVTLERLRSEGVDAHLKSPPNDASRTSEASF